MQYVNWQCRIKSMSTKCIIMLTQTKCDSFSLFDPLEQSGESSSLVALNSCSIVRCPGGVICSSGGVTCIVQGSYNAWYSAVKPALTGRPTVAVTKRWFKHILLHGVTLELIGILQ